MDSLYLALATAEAEKHVGATCPNPPVGATVVGAGLNAGRVLAVSAHVRAGHDHAEVAALKTAVREHGTAAVRGATLYVTLEPCNHFGKTPPCTHAIVAAGIARVVYGAADPNKQVKGGGAEALRAAGLTVELFANHGPSARLLDGFKKRSRTGLPWVVHKQAFRLTAENTVSMIPEVGQKTFTVATSLELAHLERRRSDAILTGIGTVLADAPYFNVRHLEDHCDKRRWLVVLSRSGRRAPEAWRQRQFELGFDVLEYTSLEAALEELGARGALRALIEAGPALSAAVRDKKIWDESLTFIQRGKRDDVFREYACSQES